MQEFGCDISLPQLVKAKGLPDSLVENTEFKEILEKFNATFNIEFSPTASVIGAIVSQEIVKVIT